MARCERSALPHARSRAACRARTGSGWPASVHAAFIVIVTSSGSLNTVEHYKHTTRHLAAGIGNIRLDKLTPDHVDRFLSEKAQAGLSRSYIRQMRNTLVQAIGHAQGRGLVSRNVADLSVLPKAKPPTERRSLTAVEARSLLEAARDEHLEALMVVGLAVGLRPGELTGLLWSDLELDADPPTLRVSGSMKRRPDGSLVRDDPKRSRAGRRTVALPMVAVDALRTHLAKQAEDRIAAGPAWSANGLVFASAVGTPLDPSNVRRAFKRVASKAGLSEGFPYLLRHSAASLLLDGGASIEQVADILGDNPETLLRYYRHRVRPVADAGLRMQDVLAAKQ